MLQSIGNDVLVPGVKNLLLALGDMAISVANLKKRMSCRVSAGLPIPKRGSKQKFKVHTKNE
jgi:hypothetical protein